jgi:ABC-2 type transport system ATP-binding protein
MFIIETNNLTRKFGKITAVDNLNLSVDSGELLAFLGPNGAGKTTTIRILSGIIAPTSGFALISGLRTDKEVEKLHEHIGLLTETPGFYENLSAYFNLEYFATFYSDLNVKVQLEKYLKLFGLWERRGVKVGSFSKGMKQRLALARAMIHEPQILFLDEPTSGLDPEAAYEVRETIKTMKNTGRTIFLSTHNLSEAEELAGRIAIFQTRLLALDSVNNLRDKLFTERIIIKLETVTDNLINTIQTLPFVKHIDWQDHEIKIQLTDNETYRSYLVKAIVEAGGNVISVNTEQHSLEEIYLSLLRREKND